VKLSETFLWISTAIGAIASVVWLADRISEKKGPAKGADSIRQRIVNIARTQLGKADLETYLASAAPDFVGQKPEWCGIFALWVLKQAGLGAGVTWIVAKGFIFRLPRTQNPEPGDIAYFNKFQHQAIVAAVRGNEIDLINGNGKGGVVTESTTTREQAEAFYSIQPWIAAKAAQDAGVPEWKGDMRALQTAINAALAKAHADGKHDAPAKPLAVDGKAGALTCAAVRWLVDAGRADANMKAFNAYKCGGVA
jgi:hypothetical protein